MRALAEPELRKNDTVHRFASDAVEGSLAVVLARYRIVRGRRPPGDPLPKGTRVDTRKHTRHFLRPDAARVETLLKAPTDPEAARAFADAYLRTLAERFETDPAAFEALAETARRGDVYLGCSCPTKRQPDVMRCHTVLALRFFAERFDGLDVRLPDALPDHDSRDKKRS